MRIFTRGWALLAMLCSIMLAATIAHAQDAPYQYPIGTETDFTASGNMMVDLDGLLLGINHEGDVSLETISNDDEEGIATTFRMLAFNASGYNTELGGVTLTVDAARTDAEGLVSRIGSRDAAAPFPATGELAFYAQIIIKENPEDVYRSDKPLILKNDNIQTWGGEEGIEFRQASDVTFINIHDPSRQFVVRDLKSVLVIVPPIKNDVCKDPCCHTDALSLNTGFNHAAGTVYPINGFDSYWTIIADQSTTRIVPRAPNVITKLSGWAAPQPNTQWIGANKTAFDEFLGQVTYQKCFCLCQASMLTFSMNILVDDQADIYLDGAYIGSTPDLAFTTPTKLNFTRALKAGQHCIEVIVRNNYKSHAGLNIQGTIQGAGLLKYTCCGPTPPPLPPCMTNDLTMVTNNTWTLVSGPKDGKPYPRCSDIITNPHPAWAKPIAGTNWIGPNSSGSSAPPPAGGSPNVYIYRKCFCVELPGTYVITITSMADDAGEAFLNGVLLGTTGGFGGPVTKTYTVALGKGCNCFDFRVRDIGFAVTGLDAKINIKGPRMLEEKCCSCSSCSTTLQPPTDTPLELTLQGGGGHADAGTAAHPMLFGIPDEKSGLTMVHYMLDREAQAEVALYKVTGERVMVLDEGKRAYGAHQVSLATKELPAGSYRLELVYGDEEALSVPVEVQ